MITKNLNKKILKSICKSVYYEQSSIKDEILSINIEDNINLNNYLKTIDKIELIMRLEFKFNITIEDNIANELIDKETLTLKDIKNLLRKYNIIDITERKTKIQKLNLIEDDTI